MKITGRVLIPCAMAVAGLFAAFGPLLASGLSRMQVDKGDTRHLNYVLEHAYRWTRGQPPHRDLGSPPFFYPEENTAAYSETLFGVVPFYAPWRWIGLEPDTALQLWMLTVSLLNFGAFHLFLRRCLGLGSVAAASGAFLFAFGSVRNVQIGHQHLLPHFFTVTALIACVGVFRPETTPASRRSWILAFFASLVAQIYAGFYLAWFLGLGIALALLGTLLVPESRRRLSGIVRSHALVLAVSAAVSAAAVWPLLSHDLAAARTVGRREFEGVVPFLPAPAAWLNLGPSSWLYGGTTSWPVFRALERLEWEKRLGLGIVTPLLIAWGLGAERARPGVRVLLLASLSAVALCTPFPGGWVPWRLVFDWFPAGDAIRAVPRIALLLLVPAGLGLAFCVERLAKSVSKPALVLVLVFVALEQGQTMPSYDKRQVRRHVAALASRMPSGCEAFFYSPVENRRQPWETHVDAMWVELATGVPTINGYSSNFPPGWMPLFDHAIQPDRPTDEPRLRAALAEWMRRHGRSMERACWLEMKDAAP